MSSKSDEYAKLPNDNNVVTHISGEQTLKDTEYQKVDYQQGSFKVVLEFPSTQHNTTQLEREIKDILSSELQDRLRNIS